MGEWHKTSCVLCAQNCGLEALVEDDRLVKIRPDKSNPRSVGYTCRKGLNVIYHQHHDQRLTHPLKRVGGIRPLRKLLKSSVPFWTNMDPVPWPIWAVGGRVVTSRLPSVSACSGG